METWEDELVWPHFSEGCGFLGSNGRRERNTLISVSNVKIQMIESQGQSEMGVSVRVLQCVQTVSTCLCLWTYMHSHLYLYKHACRWDRPWGTCWCSILMSATSLWSSSCSLLSSSQACFTWLCSLTSWMLSCLTASSSSFSWACSLARRLCSVLRRYHSEYHQTVGV